MTAEIAILNKAAVALAADSAVTIQGGGQEKVYNSVNKIFELSSRYPVGLMIYGSTEFMGIPLETVAKIYRENKYDCDQRNSLFDYADDFLSFLKNDMNISESDQNRNINTIICDVFESVHREILSRSRSIFTKDGPFKRAFKDLIHMVLDKRLTSLKSLSNASEFDDASVNLMIKRYDSTFNDCLADVFSGIDLTKEMKKKFKTIASLYLYKDTFSGHQSGIVIAGFGKNDIFPCLLSYTMDGIIAGKLKIGESNKISINRDSIGAEIVPFAQSEMVERFLDGVDPDYDRYIERSMQRMLSNFGKDLIEKYNTGNQVSNDAARTSLDEAVRATLAETFSKAAMYRKRVFRDKVLNMVRFMPRQEMGNMAESLINLTSLKRRVSAETETVGGPVDVALISKNDGFVWIKRKHYFSKEFNPRFFARLRA